MEEKHEMKLKTEEEKDEKLKTKEDCEADLKTEENCEAILKMEKSCEANLKTEESCEAELKTEEDCEVKLKKEEDSDVNIEMEEFLGKKYVMVRQENFEDFLLYLGKGYFARKAALSLHPEVWLTKNEGSYNFSFHSILVSYDITFVPGVEFDEVKPDGKMKSVITLEGNKMIHIQKDDKGRVVRHVREFFDDRMITTTTAKGLDKTVIRYHELVQ